MTHQTLQPWSCSRFPSAALGTLFLFNPDNQSFFDLHLWHVFFSIWENAVSDNEIDLKVRIACEIAVDAGVLGYCKFDDCFFEPRPDRLELAYQIASLCIDVEDPRVAIFKGNEDELIGLVSIVQFGPLPTCPHCEGRVWLNYLGTG